MPISLASPPADAARRRSGAGYAGSGSSTPVWRGVRAVRPSPEIGQRRQRRDARRACRLRRLGEHRRGRTRTVLADMPAAGLSAGCGVSSGSGADRGRGGQGIVALDLHVSLFRHLAAARAASDVQSVPTCSDSWRGRVDQIPTANAKITTINVARVVLLPSRDMRRHGSEPGRSTAHHVEAEAQGDGDLRRVERDERDRPGQPVGGGEVDGVGEAQRLQRGRASAARSRQRWSTGTTWTWSHVRRTASSRSARSIGSSVRRSIAGSASVSASAEAHQTGSPSSASSTTRRCGPSTASASSALGVEYDASSAELPQHPVEADARPHGDRRPAARQRAGSPRAGRRAPATIRRSMSGAVVVERRRAGRPGGRRR